ncbi:hypothetical protein Dimus_024479, partial [Dionaea muscipula]
ATTANNTRWRETTANNRSREDSIGGGGNTRSGLKFGARVLANRRGGVARIADGGGARWTNFVRPADINVRIGAFGLRLPIDGGLGIGFKIGKKRNLQRVVVSKIEERDLSNLTIFQMFNSTTATTLLLHLSLTCSAAAKIRDFNLRGLQYEPLGEEFEEWKDNWLKLWMKFRALGIIEIGICLRV